MNPRFQLASILGGKRKKLERRCPVCGQLQQVPQSALREIVACTRCSAPVPPPPKD